MKPEIIIEIINNYGIPTLGFIAAGYFIYWIYNYTTKQIKPSLSQTHVVLIKLLDRIRMLDNDIIRLRSKLDPVIQLQEKQKQTDENK